ncbi:FtsK/SpoIIIE family DNA translocase [Compostibacter hankyongensis]|uniref:DNA translocase FtsK n=1 Tax=Compostibacter hankyongensis TaxID=1007089 RepID=A0ABP8G266_9BACT
MAGNRLKTDNSTKSRKTGAERLKKDKVADVKMKDLVKDERTHKVTGVLCLLLTLYLFIAFTSYLFTWQDDQDKVFRLSSDVLFREDIQMENLLGRLGAFVAHLFFYDGIGITAYFCCWFFFILGVNCIVGRRVFRIWRNFRYMLFGIVLLSTAFAFVFQGWQFPWGGALGNMISQWLSGFLGTLGTTLLLAATGLAFLIWQFNFDFKLPRRSPRPVVPPVPEDTYAPADGPQEVKPQPLGLGNLLKDDDTATVINPLHAPETEPAGEMTLIEKDVPPPAAETPAAEKETGESSRVDLPLGKETTPLPARRPAKENGEVTLEINPAHEEEKSSGRPPNKAVKEQGLYEPTLDLQDYRFPTLDLLENHGGDKIIHDNNELENNKNQIIETLRNYDISIQKISATVGPTVTLYEIVPAAGVRISRIRNLEDDIALSLAALGIRIIAPIPGKGTIGIEVPNVKKSIVSMQALLASEKFQNSKMSLPIAVGKKIDNENFIVDLATMPHLLMAGATGQGKSVGINALLVSLLYKRHPSQLKLVLVDPKKVELSIYRLIEKHFLAKLPGEEEAIITDTKKVVHTLNALCIEMDNRYDLLKEAGARNIREYNEKFIHRRLNPQKGHQYLPFIVLVVDEFADLIMTAGKEVEMPIARLAQLARAVGIHLIIATQRPSVNIITGTIKANFPARMAFKVSSKVDSRTILDIGGAEQLIGKGDMLISYNGELVRLQCAFVDTPEVEKIVEYIGAQQGYPEAFLLPEYVDEKELENREFGSGEKDPLFEEAARVIVQTQQGSTSLLQRRMKLGYNRAGRLMDQLESAGIVGPNLGSKARDVLFKTETELEEYLQQLF